MAKTKRGHNEGSISKRSNGRWRAQLYQSGKRLSKDFSTKSEAQTWIRSLQTNIDHGFQIVGSAMTLEEYLPEWLENRRLSLREKQLTNILGSSQTTFYLHLVKAKCEICDW